MEGRKRRSEKGKHTAREEKVEKKKNKKNKKKKTLKKTDTQRTGKKD